MNEFDIILDTTINNFVDINPILYLSDPTINDDLDNKTELDFIQDLNENKNNILALYGLMRISNRTNNEKREYGLAKQILDIYMKVVSYNQILLIKDMCNLKDLTTTVQEIVGIAAIICKDYKIIYSIYSELYNHKLNRINSTMYKDLVKNKYREDCFNYYVNRQIASIYLDNDKVINKFNCNTLAIYPNLLAKDNTQLIYRLLFYRFYKLNDDVDCKRTLKNIFLNINGDEDINYLLDFVLLNLIYGNDEIANRIIKEKITNEKLLTADHTKIINTYTFYIRYLILNGKPDSINDNFIKLVKLLNTEYYKNKL